MLKFAWKPGSHHLLRRQQRQDGEKKNAAPCENAKGCDDEAGAHQSYDHGNTPWQGGGVRVIGAFWVCGGILEYLQHFSPGRHPSIEDFAASALGALCGGLAIALLWRRLSARPH